MRPVVCMITDRRRLGPGWETAWQSRIEAAAHAGVHLVQVREPDLDARALVRLVEAAVAAVRGTRTRIVVNDRADVARAAGAHGVHLRAQSFPAGRARLLLPRPHLLGRSIHGADDARHLDPDSLDYLVYGTVFQTGSKPGVSAAGTPALAAAARATTLPVLAVGGITADRLPEVALAGAAGFAAIGLFADCPVDRLQVLVRQASLAFDTPAAVP